MNQGTWKRNTSGMTAHAHRRREETFKRVEQVIDQFLREKKAITFNSVAKEAHVSKAYLYSQTCLRDHIEAFREQEREHRVRSQVLVLSEKIDSSKDLVILTKDRRIKALEAENQKPQQQLKVALAKAYEQL